MTATLTPTAGGVAQRDAALAEANRIRFARAEIKRRVAAGELTVAAAIADPATATMPLLQLLKAQPRWGDRRALRALEAAKIAPTKRAGELTPRQRLLLAATLSGVPAEASTTLAAPAAEASTATATLPVHEPDRPDAERVRQVLEDSAPAALTSAEISLALNAGRRPVADLKRTLEILLAVGAADRLTAGGFEVYTAARP